MVRRSCRCAPCLLLLAGSGGPGDLTLVRKGIAKVVLLLLRPALLGQLLCRLADVIRVRVQLGLHAPDPAQEGPRLVSQRHGLARPPGIWGPSELDPVRPLFAQSRSPSWRDPPRRPGAPCQGGPRGATACVYRAHTDNAKKLQQSLLLDLLWGGADSVSVCALASAARGAQRKKLREGQNENRIRADFRKRVREEGRGQECGARKGEVAPPIRLGSATVAPWRKRAGYIANCCVPERSGASFARQARAPDTNCAFQIAL